MLTQIDAAPWSRYFDKKDMCSIARCNSSMFSQVSKLISSGKKMDSDMLEIHEEGSNLFSETVLSQHEVFLIIDIYQNDFGLGDKDWLSIHP